MTRSAFSRTLAVAFVLLTLTTSTKAYIGDFRTVPVEASCDQQINIAVAGMFGDLCWSTEVEFVNDGTYIGFEIHATDGWQPGAACPDAIHSYSASEILGPLPSGQYVAYALETRDSLRDPGHDYQPFWIESCLDPTLPSQPFTTHPVWQKEGGAPSAFGAALASAGDVNNDGYADVVIGAEYYDNGEQDEGRAYLVLGSADGLEDQYAWFFESDTPFAHFGHSLAGAGDVDGDGYDDVIVSAWLHGNSDEGRVYVFRGTAGGLEENPSWIVDGEVPDGGLGTAVAGAGDVDADGYDDVIVGEAYVGLDDGRAYLFLGSESGLATEPVWVVSGFNGRLGGAVASAGDVNADGYDDVIVGERTYDPSSGFARYGRALLYLGTEDGLELSPAWTATGETADSLFGGSVAGAGDVNDDGHDDVIVGESGRTFLYLGNGTGLGQTPAWTGVDYSSGSSIGDVNADGHDDVVMERDVFFGATTGLAPGPLWTTYGGGDHGGSAGDVNDDGVPDLILADSMFSGGLDAVFLYEGLPSTVDNDGDGHSPADGDCDDADPDNWATPSEPVDLAFLDKGTLAWVEPAVAGSTSVWYDVVRSDEMSDFAVGFCVETNDDTDLQADDTDDPDSGQVYYYLVRAENACPNGLGHLGYRSDGSERGGPDCL